MEVCEKTEQEEAIVIKYKQRFIESWFHTNWILGGFSYNM